MSFQSLKLIDDCWLTPSHTHPKDPHFCMSNALRRTVVIRNLQGLHARPANMLVETANQYEATIQIGRGGELADCKSIFDLLTLGAAQGTELSLLAEGVDAEEAIDSIEQLFERGFDEPVVDDTETSA